jgi:tetratricopeptide (TPR) repeat protein
MLAGMVLLASGTLRWDKMEVRWLRRSADPSRAVVPSWAAALVVAVLALLVGWQALRPLRADARVREARNQLAAKNLNALRTLSSATHLAPGEPSYWSLIGDQFSGANQPAIGLRLYERALEKDPRRFADVMKAARSAAAAHDSAAATKWYLRAVELDPNAIELKAEVAAHLIEVGQLRRAAALAEAGLKTYPDSAIAWKLEGDVKMALHEPARARKALERSLAIDPAAGAQKSLDKLDAGSPAP